MGGRLRLQHRMRIDVLRVLRPAEAAVRRLIVVLAKDAVLEPARPRAVAKPLITTPFLPCVKRKHNTHAFALADSMPAVDMPRRVHKRPRIWSVAPIDPTIVAVLAAHQAKQVPARQPVQETPPDDGLVDAARLALRVEAIRAALTDLPRQAQRLLRWQVRRGKLSQQRFTYTSPIRPGPPPGKRERARREVDDILDACHCLAYDARFNSS
jgi:hypothetical protein